MVYGFPKGLIVAVVFILGLVAFYFIRPPARQCEAQIQKLKELQKGKVFSGQGKNMAFRPRILSYIETCKLGNSPGACFELFSTLRGLLRDLQGIPLDCAPDFESLPEVEGSLREGLTLLVQIAWGETPPEQTPQGVIRQNWLETSDLALYCGLRDMFARFYGPEKMQQLKMSISKKLPGEAPILNAGECVNCEFRKSALQAFSEEEIRSRSLFGLRCELFR